MWGEVRWNEERFHPPPHKIVDMQCRKEGENSGSKKEETWAPCCGGETALGKASTWAGFESLRCHVVWG